MLGGDGEEGAGVQMSSMPVSGVGLSSANRMKRGGNKVAPDGVRQQWLVPPEGYQVPV